MMYKECFPMLNIDIVSYTFFPNGTSQSKGMKTNYCFRRQPRHITWQTIMKPWMKWKI